MKKEQLIKYWIDASELDFRAMDNLYASKDFVWSLFLGHLVIEKLLKAFAAKNDLAAISKIHDLNKLAKAAGLDLTESLKDSFDIITSFNIEARYPDYKHLFYKKCTNKFTSSNIKRIKDIRIWLLELLKK
ncbi:MAG: HEPN domain-containing protein [Ignavibacteria bacterium]|nr:HEPN domain-containing protein [Ignavibacteria bacterium]